MGVFYVDEIDTFAKDLYENFRSHTQETGNDGKKLKSEKIYLYEKISLIY